jgi:2-dehydropantoate 2-reductase
MATSIASLSQAGPRPDTPGHTLIIGAGGMGGYFAGAFARANCRVTLYAREEHLAVLRTAGVTVHTSEESYTVPVSTTDDMTAIDIDTISLVILAVKHYALPSIARRFVDSPSGE